MKKKDELLFHIPEAQYLVFEHGPFDYEQENNTVADKLEKSMKDYDFTGTGYCYDTTPGRILYFYHDAERFMKYVRPIK